VYVCLHNSPVFKPLTSPIGLLCFALFQDKHYARQALRYFDRDLGQVVTHKDFGENCDFTYENVKNQALEIFSLAHAVGWFGKALILRDWWLSEFLIKSGIDRLFICMSTVNILSISYEVGYSSDGTVEAVLNWKSSSLNTVSPISCQSSGKRA